MEMAGEDRQQNDEMQQQQHLEMQRHLILQQPKEKCPRCNSMDTKFAYFNNLKETQPRYLCKTCKRHWTKGGQLRNVPVGGGVRPARSASTSPGGIIIRPVRSLTSFSVDSAAGRSYFTGQTHPQAPSYINIQPEHNVVGNHVLNPYMAAWRSPNQSLRQWQPPRDQNNINPTGGTSGSFSSNVDCSRHFPGNGPAP